MALVFLPSYKKVGSLTDLQSRSFDQVLTAYERNTGEPIPPTLTRGHSNERRIFIPDLLTSHLDLVWTADIAVGNPARAFSGRSPLSVNADVDSETDLQNMQ